MLEHIILLLKAVLFLMEAVCVEALINLRVTQSLHVDKATIQATPPGRKVSSLVVATIEYLQVALTTTV